MFFSSDAVIQLPQLGPSYQLSPWASWVLLLTPSHLVPASILWLYVHKVGSWKWRKASPWGSSITWQQKTDLGERPVQRTGATSAVVTSAASLSCSVGSKKKIRVSDGFHWEVLVLSWQPHAQKSNPMKDLSCFSLMISCGNKLHSLTTCNIKWDCLWSAFLISFLAHQAVGLSTSLLLYQWAESRTSSLPSQGHFQNHPASPLRPSNLLGSVTSQRSFFKLFATPLTLCCIPFYSAIPSEIKQQAAL